MIVDHLITDTFGSHIGKYSERLKVTHREGTLGEAPLLHLKSVLITSRGVSISSDAVEACCERGIPIHYLQSYRLCICVGDVQRTQRNCPDAAGTTSRLQSSTSGHNLPAQWLKAKFTTKRSLLKLFHQKPCQGANRMYLDPCGWLQMRCSTILRR